MKIALVYDFLFWRGGGERCLEALMEIFPAAPVFTLFYAARNYDGLLDGKDIRTSFMDRLPLIRKYHYLYLPLYPLAVESMRLDGFDVIVSNSWAWTKNIRIPRETLHIDYCFTPMRFAHGFFDDCAPRLGVPGKALLTPLVAMLRKWDVERSRDVHRFVAISETVKRRIQMIYGREAEVIFPPVDTHYFQGHEGPREEFYLLVSRLVPYKRVDIAVRAFRALGLPLKIVGQGGELRYLRKEASGNIEFLGYVPDEELRDLYRRGKALIMPQVEDFGIAALEAQGCGMPVLAFAEGGSRETIIEGVTGHFFNEQSPDALAAGLEEMNRMEFTPSLLRAQALRFSKDHFIRGFQQLVQE
jgi:glycosyltransferase involved in cell wall biosynthesis